MRFGGCTTWKMSATLEKDDPAAVPLLGHSWDDLDFAEDAALVEAGVGRRPRTRWNVFKKFWDNGIACIVVGISTHFLATNIVKVLENDIPVMQTLFMRSALAVPTLVILGLAFGGRPIFGHPKNFPFLLLRGVVGTVNIIFVLATVHLLPLGDALTLIQSTPATTAIAAWLFRVDPRFRWPAFVGVGGCAVGVVFVANPPFLFGSGEPWTNTRKLGLCMGLSAVVMTALVYTIVRFLSKSERPNAIVIWIHQTGLLALFPLIFHFPKAPVLNIGLKNWLLIVTYTALSLSSQLCNCRGVQLTSATLAATMNPGILLFARASDVLIFHDKVHVLGIVGTGLMVLGAIGVAIGKRDTKVESTTAIVADGEMEQSEEHEKEAAVE